MRVCVSLSLWLSPCVCVCACVRVCVCLLSTRALARACFDPLAHTRARPLVRSALRPSCARPQVFEEAADVGNAVGAEAVGDVPGVELVRASLEAVEGIQRVSLGRSGIEQKVVSQDFELWLAKVRA